MKKAKVIQIERGVVYCDGVPCLPVTWCRHPCVDSKNCPMRQLLRVCNREGFLKWHEIDSK